MYLRIPSVRTDNVSENSPTPTLFKPAKRTAYDVYCLRGEITKGPGKKTQTHTNQQQTPDINHLLSLYIYVKLSHLLKNQCCTCNRNGGLLPFFRCIFPPLQNKVCDLCSSINWQGFEWKEGWGWARVDLYVARHVWVCCEQRKNKLVSNTIQRFLNLGFKYTCT